MDQILGLSHPRLLPPFGDTALPFSLPKQTEIASFAAALICFGQIW